MKNLSSVKLFFLSVIAIALFSCNGNYDIREKDTPTSGEVNIVVDESYSLLFDTQIYTFQSLYTEAKVHASYKNESEAIKDLMNDSCKVIVLNRELTAEEKKRFEANNIYPKTTQIAEDAVALIVNKDNSDTLLDVQQILDVLKGTKTNWNQITESSQMGEINVVFDNANSANARYMRETLLEGASFQKNCFAVKSNPEVINYVSKNKNALGFISVNWISDTDDSLSQKFLKEIKVVALSQNGEKYHKPYQAYIKTKEYPFARSVYMISRQTRAGLGMGFVSFVAGDKGQRIILKAGLIPAIAPVRVIQINNN